MAGWARGPSARYFAQHQSGDAMKTSLTATLTALLLTLSSGLGAEDTPKPFYPQYPSETPTNFTPVSDAWDYKLRRHDPHARWREAPHHHPGAQGRIACRHAAHAHALRGEDTHRPHAQRAPGPHAAGLRQRDRRDPRGRLHPRGTGRTRQVRLGGRLRNEPPGAWPAESDASGRCHRYLRHHRVAGEKRAREQRQGGNAGHFV